MTATPPPTTSTPPPQEEEPRTDPERAAYYARKVAEHLAEAKRYAAHGMTLAVHHNHTEAGRRFGVVSQHIGFAEKNLGHAQVADSKAYNFREP